ncbi:hypothetical protein MSAN_02029800 [Mycena sanguinolenta]|uniref:Uncharacterized protein n=1 Tax=Mycena sanguinolenta TaxID=230812 RepID=A0A8H6XLA1_9AGAR|nr:hypothetical protein MSAN_02029800 [Mycena sanguinolenta]
MHPLPPLQLRPALHERGREIGFTVASTTCIPKANSTVTTTFVIFAAAHVRHQWSQTAGSHQAPPPSFRTALAHALRAHCPAAVR